MRCRRSGTTLTRSAPVQLSWPRPAAGCAGIRSGAIYVGPVFSSEEVGDEICPWCIADGSAAAQLEAGFTDIGWGVPATTSLARAVREIGERTPGFVGWQQEHWLYHCADGAAFLGRAGYPELHAHPDVVEMLLRENDEFGWTADP